MKKLLIGLALFTSGCHPVFADTLGVDARNTCESVGNKTSECIDIVASDYVQAMMLGADLANFNEPFDKELIRGSLKVEIIDRCPKGKLLGCEKIAELTLAWYETGYSMYKHGEITSNSLDVIYGDENVSKPN